MPSESLMYIQFTVCVQVGSQWRKNKITLTNMYKDTRMVSHEVVPLCPSLTLNIYHISYMCFLLTLNMYLYWKSSKYAYASVLENYLN